MYQLAQAWGGARCFVFRLAIKSEKDGILDNEINLSTRAS
jgi:hypothetical protein